LNARPTALLALFLLACGASDPRTWIDAGTSARNAGKHGDAAACFGKALEALEAVPSDPQVKTARLGHVRAVAHLDAARARAEFLDYAQESGQVTEADWHEVTSEFLGAGAFVEALEILEAFQEAYPESPHFDALFREVEEQARKSGALVPEWLKAIAGDD